MKERDKIALREWDIYRKNLIKATPLPDESPAVKKRRIKELEKDKFAWFKYYFPNYCDADFAKFQRLTSNKIIDNNIIYVVKPWARELAKSATSMMDELYLICTKRAKNLIIVSWSFDNAVDLATPGIINLESNQRIINDYGIQRTTGTWDYTRGKWITANGVVIRAIGAGQSPRGTRNEEKRPDYIRLDDMDTDELTRNEKRLNNAWNWIEQALYPCMSIKPPRRIIFCGNIIAKDCIIKRAIEMADYAKIVNLLDESGMPSWKERFTKSEANHLISKISYISAQKEYFNNPITEGTVFKDINYKRLQSLNKYPFLLLYIDPSFKDTKKNDYKGLALIGKHKHEYHLHKARVEQTTSKKLAEWCMQMHEYVNGKTPLYMYIEANANQDEILKKVNKHLADMGAGFRLTGDYRSKGDKFSRIEATLEPLNSNGELWFNEAEKKNEHMKRAEEQMKAIEPTLSAHDDFPDALEGAVSMYNQKIVALVPPRTGQRKKNKKRY